jgi:hypothetical protein
MATELSLFAVSEEAAAAHLATGHHLATIWGTGKWACHDCDWPQRERQKQGLEQQIVDVEFDNGTCETMVWWHHDDPLFVGQYVDAAHWYAPQERRYYGMVRALRFDRVTGARHILRRIWHRYQAVECPFCLVLEEQPCVKVHGKNAGKPADWPHTKRAYKYFNMRRRRLNDVR